ncbi:TRIO and F-actin-binding protein [Anabarilius grahami]|uniref:TRIO and F-actin-binding protein n=1 Tax=Anabarilius grahami TaxID=495550 RepID=A0A3N0Y1I9_ANAGA|nr:TRIO and F-actin-binding protein [Anabarilius grahami]
MPLAAADEPVCPKFQPNIFDSTRCHDCLRQKHLHNTCSGGELVPEPRASAAHSDEKDTSAKDDSDVLSVVSSYCDVSRGGRGFEDSSLCILSPDCDLYLCDGDDDQSSDSQGDDSIYSSSTGPEEYSRLLHHPSSCHRMTRLDPPPHRTSPRGWTEVSQSRGDGFGQFGFSHGSVKDRGERESGYFSLGRAAGSRTLRDQSPPAPYRHSERGHPLPSNKSPEPKSAIPFRNPDLGLPSERRTSEFQNPEQLAEDYPPQYPPDPLDLSVEVEALAGPRALSPTPFKQAESIGASSRRGGRNAHTSPLRQPGTLNSSQRGPGLSRSSSPSRSTSPFRRAESSSSLNTVGFRSSIVSHGQDRATVSPARNSYSGGLQKNLKSFASTAGTVSNVSKSLSYMDLRGSLRKPDTNSSFTGSTENRGSLSPSKRTFDGPAVRKTEMKSPSYERGHDRQSSAPSVGRYDSRNQSPSRQSYDSPAVRKTEMKSPSYERGHDRQSSSPSVGRYDSRNQSPSRRSYDSPAVRKTETKGPSYERGHDRQFSSSSSKGRYDSRSQSPKGRLETNGSSSQIREGRRSASPVRKGYGTPSQSDRGSMSNGWSHARNSPSPSRKSYEMQSQTTVKKPEAKSSLHSYNRDSRHSSPIRDRHQNPGSSSLRKSEMSQSSSNCGPKSRSPSPLRWANDNPSQSLPRKAESGRSPSVSTLRRDIADHIPLRNTMSDRTGSTSYVRNSTNNQPQHDSNPSSGRWRSSTHSLNSQSVSRNSSPSRHSGEKKQISSFPKSVPVAWETPQDGSKRSSMRQVQEVQSSMPNNRRAPSRHRSPSPPVERHTSSQSSMDSESSHLSGGSSGLNREEYAMMADLPKVKTVFHRESPSHLGKIESRQKRELSRYKPASHSQSKSPHSDWDELEDERDSGTLSRAHSSSSLHTQTASSPAVEQIHPSRSSGPKQKTHRPSVYFSCSVEQTDEEPMQQARALKNKLSFPDLLNFKKGWMSKLDESGEVRRVCLSVMRMLNCVSPRLTACVRVCVCVCVQWRKHWFVLTDAGLKYYRDSAAEERDEVDGEIDLKSCVKVSEFDVEKNYGFQIQTRDAMFTLSAMTAGIRRNWIEILRKNVRPGSSPDLTQSVQHTHTHTHTHVISRLRCVSSCRLPNSSIDKENVRQSSSLRLRSQSEASSTTANPAHSKFDYVELSPVATPSTPANQRESGEGQVREHSQWQEERRRDDAHNQWEAVLSRKGPGQLSEQKRIEEEIERKWAEFERLPLKEMRSLPPMGSRPSANQALEREVVLMEALQKAHREELEKTAQLKETRGMDTHTLNKQQQAEVASLRRELQGLSERFSQKCLELKRAQQHHEHTERQMSQKDRQMEQLKRDNQDLQARLSEEVKVIRSLVTGQGSDAGTDGGDRSWCEMQVLLRVRENELQYLHQELNSLRNQMHFLTTVLLRVRENELQYLHQELNSLRNQMHFLTTEKSSVCERYREVCEELSAMKSRSEREAEALREHLTLALSALHEHDNSLRH